MEINEIVLAVAGVLGGILLIAAAIVKLTPSTKDDEIVGKIQDVVGPMLDAVDKDEKPKE